MAHLFLSMEIPARGCPSSVSKKFVLPFDLIIVMVKHAQIRPHAQYLYIHPNLVQNICSEDGCLSESKQFNTEHRKSRLLWIACACAQVAIQRLKIKQVKLCGVCACVFVCYIGFRLECGSQACVRHKMEETIGHKYCAACGMLLMVIPFEVLHLACDKFSPSYFQIHCEINKSTKKMMLYRMVCTRNR